MKNSTILFSLLVTLMVVCGSCSKDDTPSPGKEQVSFNVVFSGIKVNANYQNVTPPSQTKQLSEVMSAANKDKAAYVKTGSIQYSDSYILLQGLNAGESLSSVTFRLLNGQTEVTSFNLGKVDANLDGSSKKYADNACVTFLNTVTTNLVTKKSITLQVVLNGGDKDVSNLTITVHTTADFGW